MFKSTVSKNLSQPITDEPFSACLFLTFKFTKAKTVRRDCVSQFPYFRDEKSLSNSEVRDLLMSGLKLRPLESYLRSTPDHVTPAKI